MILGVLLVFRVGAAGDLNVMGLRTNGPFGKTIANDTSIRNTLLLRGFDFLMMEF